MLRGSILDCGFGKGENACISPKKVTEVVGIDASPNAIREAESKANDRGIAVKSHALDLGGSGVPSVLSLTVDFSMSFLILTESAMWIVLPLWRKSFLH